MIRVTILSGERTNEKEVGSVEFPTLQVFSDKDYKCSPVGLLTYDEVTKICDALRHLPQIHSGTVGRYCWREVT